MSTQIDLGPVLSVPKGNWNAETTYEKLNLVRHNSSAWVCNVATSTGVEPAEDSTDWYLLVTDTSNVSSVNGMRGDVQLTDIDTPSANDDSTKIANTAWVNDRLDSTLNAANTYTTNSITEATTSILATAASDATNKANLAVTQAATAGDAKYAVKTEVVKTVNGTAPNASGNVTLTKQNIVDSLGYTPPTTNTTYSNMTGATTSAAGTAGLVPAPAAGKNTSFLRGDGTWVIPTDTKYTLPAATSSVLGGVKVGSNITVSSGTISLTKANVTSALGYTPLQTYTLPTATSSVLGGVKIGSNITVSSGTISLTKSNVTSALGYTPPSSSGITTVKGQIGSAWAANSTSITLPSGGTWFVWNVYGYKDVTSSSEYSTATTYWGVSTQYSAGSNQNDTAFVVLGSTYSGGTTVYARKCSRQTASWDDPTQPEGKLCAVRIS